MYALRVSFIPSAAVSSGILVSFAAVLECLAEVLLTVHGFHECRGAGGGRVSSSGPASVCEMGRRGSMF